jgi:hypothetical protein
VQLQQQCSIVVDVSTWLEGVGMVVVVDTAASLSMWLEGVGMVVDTAASLSMWQRR